MRTAIEPLVALLEPLQLQLVAVEQAAPTFFGVGAIVLGTFVSIVGALVSRGAGNLHELLLIGLGAIVLGVVLFVHGRRRQESPPDPSVRGVYFVSIGIFANPVGRVALRASRARSRSRARADG